MPRTSESPPKNDTSPARRGKRSVAGSRRSATGDADRSGLDSLTSKTDAIDALMAEIMSAWRVPGAALAVVSGDEVVYLKGLGVKEIGKPGAVTPDTLFAIASTTKAFTTAA
ncbi:MAG TPA: serine hydrolase, partial [Armatimonadota bacterium]|nr:serine hydrolase [Armatimonadota bacterium]